MVRAKISVEVLDNAVRQAIAQIDALAQSSSSGARAAAATRDGIRPSTAKRHVADLRARSGLTTEQPIHAGRAAG